MKLYLCIGRFVPLRMINTKVNQHKGKVSVGRRNVLKHDLKEVIEVKVASSFIKKFNWENKHLFGSIVSAVKSVKNTCSPPQKNKVKLKSKELPGDTTQSKNNPTEDVLKANFHASIINFPLLEDGTSMFLKENISLEMKKMPMKSPPSVTAILEKTISPEQAAILHKWRSRMIKEMGEENFKQYQQDLFNTGATFHNSLNMFLNGTPETELEVQPSNLGHWQSLKKVLPLVSNVKLLEKRLLHPVLNYCGIVDYVGNYKDHLVVVDWKTSKKPKLSITSTFDAPLQVAAYVGALNFDPKFNHPTSKGAIVIAYDDGNPATVHYLSEKVLLNYWKQWLGRLSSYWQLFS